MVIRNCYWQSYFFLYVESYIKSGKPNLPELYPTRDSSRVDANFFSLRGRPVDLKCFGLGFTLSRRVWLTFQRKVLESFPNEKKLILNTNGRICVPVHFYTKPRKLISEEIVRLFIHNCIKIWINNFLTFRSSVLHISGSG